MVECEGGQNAFGIVTEIQQLDYRLGGVMLQEPSQGELNEFGRGQNCGSRVCVRDDDGQVWVDDPNFFCFVFESRCFRIGRWRWSPMMESITHNLGEFYLPDANPGGASSDVLSASLLPLETVY